MRQNAVSRTPLRHTIWVEGAACGPGVTGKAKKTHLAVSGIWGSPVIKAGQAVTFARDGDGYAFTLAGEAFKIPSEELGKRFDIETANEDGETGRWEVKHEGRLAAFPDMAQALRKRAARLGIDRWLDWDYQLDDLVETSMGRVGCIVSWEMGLGKGRLAAALCVMGGMKRNLITVDASLVPEIVEELSGLPIPPERWQVIASPGDLACLKTVSVISYQWVTNEFAESLQTGAKREIPRIVDLPRYRTMLTPHVKRRLAAEAVRFACNYPQRPSEFGSHGKPTTKQLYALDRPEELVAGGHKTLLFADSPGNLEVLGGELDRRGIDNLVFHGEIPIRKPARPMPPTCISKPSSGGFASNWRSCADASGTICGTASKRDNSLEWHAATKSRAQIGVAFRKPANPRKVKRRQR